MHAHSFKAIVLITLTSLVALNSCAPKTSVSARKEGGTMNQGIDDAKKEAEKKKDEVKPSPKTKPDIKSKNPPKDKWESDTPDAKDPANDEDRDDASNEDSESSESCHKGSEFICKVEYLITKKTNAYRTSRGLQAVENDAKIGFVSRDWSQKQASRGMISHSGFPSARAALYQQEFNVRTSLRGENVAMFSGMSSGVESDEEAERVAQRFAVMWWNSPGHRANMLGRGHTSLGNGVYKSRNGYYATQIFK